ncbi:MAG: phosphopyruvate hydratase [Candidatus Andersenbacteria bacterium]|nr:phosphopyruvate hydratase [Candidatus Andersenbacteria bacterium]MBI3251071.1 phosphopyruvate hydratase [Candidatus Andersenbacteria bacterium]
MAKIEQITAQEVLDSRGIPTVRATVVVTGGYLGTATVPSGASTGSHEAHELRDGDEKRYGGKGVQQAVKNVTTSIHAALIGKDTGNQAKIDRTMIELDGTPQKTKLGANAILAVSLACARAEAAAQNLPLYLYLQELLPNQKAVLPVPQMNLINGGTHASNGISIQEYHVVPAGASSFAEALRMGTEVSYALKTLLLKDGFRVEVGDEGGFAPAISKSDDAFNYLVRAIEEAGYIPGSDIWLGIDAAASEFYDSEQHIYTLDGGPLAPADLAARYRDWRERYPLISVEDPFAEDRWDEWQVFTEKHKEVMQIVGDDLFVTNTQRIQEGIVRGVANAVLIKPNQIGTLSETLQAVALTQRAEYNVIISHRSGETEDTFIADLSVAVGAGQIKTGAPVRSERTGKYNRLLEIEAQMQGIKLGHSLQRFLERQTSHFAAAGIEIERRPAR